MIQTLGMFNRSSSKSYKIYTSPYEDSEDSFGDSEKFILFFRRFASYLNWGSQVHCINFIISYPSLCTHATFQYSIKLKIFWLLIYFSHVSAFAQFADHETVFSSIHQHSQLQIFLPMRGVLAWKICVWKKHKFRKYLGQNSILKLPLAFRLQFIWNHILYQI